MDFEDVRLCDLLGKVSASAATISQTRSASGFKKLGKEIQDVYDFFVTSSKAYEPQHAMLKNLFSSFNYAAVIINDGIKKKAIDRQSSAMLSECLEIIAACCANVKKSLEGG